MDILKSIEHEQLKNKIPELKIGNTVRVHVRIKEGNKERIQVFEGIIIKKQGGGVNETFTVRRISYGVGVEKTFLVHSPMVEKVELVRVGKARRAKLYYLRDRVGKAAKTKEKVGARIENREIVIKEEVVPGENTAEQEATAEEVAEARIAYSNKVQHYVECTNNMQNLNLLQKIQNSAISSVAGINIVINQNLVITVVELFEIAVAAFPLVVVATVKTKRFITTLKENKKIIKKLEPKAEVQLLGS